VNEEAARRFVAGDVEMLQTLVVAYLHQAPRLPGDLIRAARLEPSTFHREIVRLRGACGLLFAECLLAVLDQIETALNARRLSRRKAVELLLPELGRLEQTLLSMRGPLERELGWKVQL
jgi:hypothetical protein